MNQAYAQNNGSTSTIYSSGQLGQVQGDAARSITGNAGVMDDGGIFPGALYVDFYASNGYTAQQGLGVGMRLVHSGYPQLPLRTAL